MQCPVHTIDLVEQAEKWVCPVKTCKIVARKPGKDTEKIKALTKERDELKERVKQLEKNLRDEMVKRPAKHEFVAVPPPHSGLDTVLRIELDNAGRRVIAVGQYGGMDLTKFVRDLETSYDHINVASMGSSRLSPISGHVRTRLTMEF
jgi:hypothetical protein